MIGFPSILSFPNAPGRALQKAKNKRKGQYICQKVNKMTYFLGNISIPAETKYVEKISDTVTSFSVAENRPLRNGEQKTVFHRISIFGKRGKNLAQYLTKGRSVLVSGYEDAGAYINKEGKAVAYLQMTNARIQFATGNGKASDPTGEIPDEIVVDEVVEEEPVG